MAEVNALVDHQPLDLVKHRRVRRVAVGTIDAPRRDDPERRAVLNHRANLHRRGVRTQKHPPPIRILVRKIERVVHRARGMGLGHIERGEIVPVVLDLRPGGDREAEIGENLGQFVHHLADRVDRPARGLGRG